MPKWIMGDALTAPQRAEVLRAFVHRYTKEHKPEWARKSMPNGKPYQPLFATDDAWLEAYCFAFTKAGRLDVRVRYCEPYYLHLVD